MRSLWLLAALLGCATPAQPAALTWEALDAQQWALRHPAGRLTFRSASGAITGIYFSESNASEYRLSYGSTNSCLWGLTGASGYLGACSLPPPSFLLRPDGCLAITHAQAGRITTEVTVCAEDGTDSSNSLQWRLSFRLLSLAAGLSFNSLLFPSELLLETGASSSGIATAYLPILPGIRLGPSFFARRAGVSYGFPGALFSPFLALHGGGGAGADGRAAPLLALWDENVASGTGVPVPCNLGLWPANPTSASGDGAPLPPSSNWWVALAYQPINATGPWEAGSSSNSSSSSSSTAGGGYVDLGTGGHTTTKVLAVVADSGGGEAEAAAAVAAAEAALLAAGAAPAAQPSVLHRGLSWGVAVAYRLYTRRIGLLPSSSSQPLLQRKLGAAWTRALAAAPLIKLDADAIGLPFASYPTSIFSSLPSSRPLLLHPVAYDSGPFDATPPDFETIENSLAPSRAVFLATMQGAETSHLLMPYCNPTWWSPASRTLANVSATTLAAARGCVRPAGSGSGSPCVTETFGVSTGIVVDLTSPRVTARLDALVGYLSGHSGVSPSADPDAAAAAWWGSSSGVSSSWVPCDPTNGTCTAAAGGPAAPPRLPPPPAGAGRRLPSPSSSSPSSLSSDFVFVDQIGARKPHAGVIFTPPPPPLARGGPGGYVDGVLAFSARYASAGLHTEQGWDGLAAPSSAMVAFHGSVLMGETGVWNASTAWGPPDDGNDSSGGDGWAAVPLWPTGGGRASVLHYQHDLAPEAMASSVRNLCWSLSAGMVLSVDASLPAHLAFSQAWLRAVAQLQGLVASRAATAQLVSYASSRVATTAGHNATVAATLFAGRATGNAAGASAASLVLRGVTPPSHAPPLAVRHAAAVANGGIAVNQLLAAPAAAAGAVMERDGCVVVASVATSAGGAERLWDAASTVTGGTFTQTWNGASLSPGVHVLIDDPTCADLLPLAAFAGEVGAASTAGAAEALVAAWRQAFPADPADAASALAAAVSSPPRGWAPALSCHHHPFGASTALALPARLFAPAATAAPPQVLAFTYARVLNSSSGSSGMALRRVNVTATAAGGGVIEADPAAFPALVPASSPPSPWGPAQPDGVLGRDFLFVYWVPVAAGADEAASAVAPAVGGGVVGAVLLLGGAAFVAVKYSGRKGKVMATAAPGGASASGSGASSSGSGGEGESGAGHTSAVVSGASVPHAPLPQEMSATPVVITNVLTPAARGGSGV